MQTKILLIILFLVSAFDINAQRISFFGHHLYNKAEYSSDELKKLGFYKNDDGFYYGGLWGYDCRLYVRYVSDKSRIDEVIITIPFLEKEYLSISDANVLLNSFTAKIAKQLKTSNVQNNVGTFGSYLGNRILCDDGVISIYHDYSSSTWRGPIILRYSLIP